MNIHRFEGLAKHLIPQRKRSKNEIWWKNCIIYQIYPRSFQDSNEDGIGDLQGIIDRIDYLQELGVDAIWLSPIFPSPMTDFGYDVSDYFDIDPIYGSLQTFENLVTAAHDRGIKVILDYVANHTSDEHPWFVESRSSKTNIKRDWYIWRDRKENGNPPNNWISFFGGSAWTWDKHTAQYYLHLFSTNQPDLNWRNSQVVEMMHKAIRFWLDRGVDGFRMDAITMLIKHVELPDMPDANRLLGPELLEKHIYVHNQPELHDLLRDFHKLFDDYQGDRVIIGETGDLKPKNLVSFYGANLDEMHLPFNFILMHLPWQPDVMKREIIDYFEALPPGATPNFVFGNHDISRLATRYGWVNHRSVGMLLLTLGGVATIYYGDELGMTDTHIPKEKRRDMMADGYLSNDGGRDPARTPMQWSPEPNCGFTDKECIPWLPIASNYETVNVAKQEEDPNSTLAFYRSLIYLRGRLPALSHGSMAMIEDSPKELIAYLRQYDNQRLLIVINFSPQVISLDISPLAGRANIHLSSKFTSKEVSDNENIVVGGHESLLIQLE